MIEIISGNIFDSKEKYLCHQINCITKRAAHLSKVVFSKYPYADIYSGRTTPDKPGTIVISGNGNDQRYIINMLGQYYPGSPKYPDSTLDGSEARQKYFYKCLLKIAQIPDLESIVFPWRIACGAAGGDWKHYIGVLNNFAKFVKTKDVKVVIYKLEGTE